MLNGHAGQAAAQAGNGYNTSRNLQARVGTERQLVLDADVKLVMEFMASNIQASRLVNVVNAMADVAPVVWGHYEREAVRALAFDVRPIAAASQQSTATVSAQQAGYALDGSVAGGGGL